MKIFKNLSNPFNNQLYFRPFWVVFLGLFLANCQGNVPPTQTPTQVPQASPTPEARNIEFDGDRALEYVATQVDFGPRFPGADGHEEIQEWIINSLINDNWGVQLQEFDQYENTYTNIIGMTTGGGPPVIIGAHYDTRIYSDEDPNPEYRETPVPGANDGASGVAVLLELARVLPSNPDISQNVWLAFFDGEDNGRIDDMDWILGSTYYAENLEISPEVVVIVDMIGDADLNIYFERNSDQQYMTDIWNAAEELGYGDSFIQEAKYRITDDHIPFLQRGIPAVDIIDFDYPYWHTTEDTVDKVSARSLKIIGDTLINWLESY